MPKIPRPRVAPDLALNLAPRPVPPKPHAAPRLSLQRTAPQRPQPSQSFMAKPIDEPGERVPYDVEVFFARQLVYMDQRWISPFEDDRDVPVRIVERMIAHEVRGGVWHPYQERYEVEVMGGVYRGMRFRLPAEAVTRRPRSPIAEGVA